MGRGKTNKAKGSNAERLYAKLFRELGYTFCKTSRQESRVTDDAGIDLTNLPWNVQVKAGYPQGLNVAGVLGIIDERLPKLFPPEDKIHEKPNILIHRMGVGRGKKRTEFDDLVYIRVKDFLNTLPLLSSISNSKKLVQEIDGNLKKGTSHRQILSKLNNFEGVEVLYHHRKNATVQKYSHLAIMSFKYFSTLIKKDA